MYCIGVDEVGRGPLAGPVMVGVVAIPPHFDWSQLPGVGDSKQISQLNRVRLFALAKALKAAGQLDFAVAAVPARRIDRIGIAPAIREALTKALTSVCIRKGLEPGRVLVKLDGGLKAPEEFTHQETIIKGDAKEPVIGLASIIAKVTRDTYMERLGTRKEFAVYGFAAHKGYGTKQHRASIATAGLSTQHRASFCRNVRFISSEAEKSTE